MLSSIAGSLITATSLTFSLTVLRSVHDVSNQVSVFVPRTAITFGFVLTLVSSYLGSRRGEHPRTQPGRRL